jgi:hypothetical protein
MSKNLTIKRSSDVLPSESPAIEVGQWYWVRQPKDEKFFGCVVHVGSNYASLRDVYERSIRVHFDKFEELCTFEPNSSEIIQDKIQTLQTTSHELMGEVQRLSLQLSVSSNPSIAAHSATEAMVQVGANNNLEDYKNALIKAKSTTLPELFSRLKETHDELTKWMSAGALLLQAKAKELKTVISSVEAQIHNVELYSGLEENVATIIQGEPAPMGTKLHLMQRLCYMDEESLANYEAGGMDFRDIAKFDAWLARKDNRDRLLPFPRCIVSFQVRRYVKDRSVRTFTEFIRLPYLEQADKKTYLYIRNGDSMYRMDTTLDFGEQLFPDFDRSLLTGKMWGKYEGNKIVGVISDNEYQSKLQAEKDEQKAYKKWSRLSKAERDKDWMSHPYSQMDQYVPYSRESVYYDDFNRKVQSDIHQHNRIAIIIQGMLDRSTILHPHPPYKLWSPEGFEAALELVYDASRALAPDELPDFEAYRIGLNASLQKGSITVGQEDAWSRQEAAKLYERSRGHRDSWPEKHFPYGNPGPGLLAQVTKYSKATGSCHYSWVRQRANYKRGATTDDIPVGCTISEKDLLNVSAYVPGDFRRFFNDPRTRADYLEWAPMLLAAEDYHAGVR